jgi:hypothetical protein
MSNPIYHPPIKEMNHTTQCNDKKESRVMKSKNTGKQTKKSKIEYLTKWKGYASGDKLSHENHPEH